MSEENRSISIGAKPRFRVVHDPGAHPLAGERRMTKFEVQFGLRYNTFNNGTVIADEVTGSQHQVVIKHIFKAGSTGGMLALLEAYGTDLETSALVTSSGMAAIVTATVLLELELITSVVPIPGMGPLANDLRPAIA